MPGTHLRKRLPAYPLPVLRVARLGVDTRAQGLGLGSALLRHVLTLALKQRDRVGCVGVMADTMPDVLAFYAGPGFLRLTGVREGLLHGDPVPMFLGTNHVAAASP